MEEKLTELVEKWERDSALLTKQTAECQEKKELALAVSLQGQNKGLKQCILELYEFMNDNF